MVGSGDPFPVSWPTDARRGYVLAGGTLVGVLLTEIGVSRYHGQNLPIEVMLHACFMTGS